MISKEFKLKRLSFYKKVKTTLQHKLRVVLKCYTVRDFVLNEDKTFTFKKTIKKHGVKLESDKELSGSFEVIELEDDQEIILRVNVG